MALTTCTWSNDVDPIYRYQKSMAMVLKNHKPVHVKHGKCSFVPRGEYSRRRTINLDLIKQQGGRVVQMVISHSSLFFIVFTY